MSLHSLTKNKDSKSTASPQQRITKNWRNKLLSWFPLYLLLGFLLLAWMLFGHVILPARTVEIATVVTQKSGISSSDVTASKVENMEGSFPIDSDAYIGEIIFQASGWIEADPYAIRATTLIDGVVESVHVLEGEKVNAGQLLATLISEDREIALREAKASLGEAKARVESEANRVQRAVARIERHQLQLATIQVELEILRDQANRLKTAGTPVYSARDVKQAVLQADAGEARLITLKSEGKELASELAMIRKDMESAEQRVELTKAMFEQAQLDLSRTQIRSPIAGVVQELFVAPGRKRMLGMDDPESGTIAILYDPKQLQARIDVPLEEAAQLAIGQPVIVRTNFIPNREFKGVVTRIVGMADIQRNTLQAKVALSDPDPRMRPDMLCRAEFLILPKSVNSRAGETRNSIQRVSIFVPEAALIEHQGEQAVVWTLNENGEKAEKRSIRIINKSHDGYFEVIEGLRPGDPIILNPPANLETGERVQFK